MWILFLCISIFMKTEMQFDKNSLNSCCPNLKQGGKWQIFFFWYLKKIFWGTTKKWENEKLCNFLFQFITLGCLVQERLIKFFSLGFSKISKKWQQTWNFLLQMSVRHNSACVIQKWLRFKIVITVRLTYIS